MNSKKNAARREMQQQRVDAGFVATHFPDVASIVIIRMYNQRGTKSLSRTGGGSTTRTAPTAALTTGHRHLRLSYPWACTSLG
jgi:hypothetical protein